MITPAQNAMVMDALDVQYFIHGYHDNAQINCQTLTEKTIALIKCDRQLQQFEQHNWNMASLHRRDSIFLKLLKLWGTRK